MQELKLVVYSKFVPARISAQSMHCLMTFQQPLPIHPLYKLFIMQRRRKCSDLEPESEPQVGYAHGRAHLPLNLHMRWRLIHRNKC